MIELKPLFSGTFELHAPIAVGTGPAGPRTVGAISGVSLAGDRLKATLASPAAADWLVRTGPFGIVDARLLLRTEDDALIYMSYGGRLDLSNPAEGIHAFVAPTFETGDERYLWLNGVQAIGKGRLIMDEGGSRLEYDFYETC